MSSMTEPFSASWPPAAAVGRGPDEHPGAAARGEPLLEIRVDPEGRTEEVRHGEVGHQRVLPEAVHLDAREEREEVDALPLEHRDRFRERGRVVAHVGVGEEDDVSRSPGRALVESVGLAEPALGRLDSRHHGEAVVRGRQPREDLGRAVGRAVVDDDHLERGIVLGEVRADGGLDVGGFVARGHDHRDARTGPRRAGPPERSSGSSGG